MSRIIINNHTNVSDAKVLNLILGVVRDGRLSDNGASYCYFTRITYPSTGEIFQVHAKRTDGGTDTFTIHLEGVQP